MGRQAYLDKIAFGRSAFEPTQSATQSTEYIQLESSQSEIPSRYHEATTNNYIQLYDERGNPINPRSHDYAKKLRASQNDVLAAVGAVERKRSPSEGLFGPNEERLESLEAEDTVGNAIGFTTMLIENLCTWWVGNIRERILTFRYHDALPVGQIVASEHSHFGASLIYAGYVSHHFATTSMEAIVHSAFVYRPIDRLLNATRASRQTKNFFRITKKALKLSLRLGLEVLLYPIFYHAALQRLGLIPSQPLLPSWTSLIPWSSSSPLLPLSLHYSASASITDCFKALLTSPVVLLSLEHCLERWIGACVYDAISSSIFRPDKPDIPSRDVNRRVRVETERGFRRPSPPLIRHAINSMLVLLSWAPQTDLNQNRAIDSAGALDPRDGQTIEIGSTQVTNVSQLDLPVVQTEDRLTTEPLEPDVITIPIDAVEEMIRSTTPPTTPGAGLDHDENDPRIRITSREGVVQMEVRLPPRVISSHTELAEPSESSSDDVATASRNEARSSRNSPYHRVTQLSCEPAKMLGEMVRVQVIGLAMLPIKMVTLRLVASHYLAAQGRYAGPHRIVSPLGLSNNFSWHSIGIRLLRVALCGAFEIAIDLGLWGFQYCAITKFGTSLFGWGTL